MESFQSNESYSKQHYDNFEFFPLSGILRQFEGVLLTEFYCRASE
jgi:hypothetical protein